MSARLRILALVVFFVGCTSQAVLQVPMGQAALVYADGHALHLLMVARITDWCKAGKVTEVDCTFLQAKNEQAVAIDQEIREGILSAEAQIDWKKVMQYLQILAGIAVKVGGL